MSNFAGSVKYGDSEMAKGVILSRLSKLIEKEPKTVIKSLRDSGVKVSDNASKIDLIDKSVEALYDNKRFRVEVSSDLLKSSEQYSNSSGSFDFSSISNLFGGGDGTDPASIGVDTALKVGGGGASGGIVGAIAGAVDSIFGTVGKFKDAKNQKEADKRALQLQLLADEKKKTNWLPVIIISGVLLIGGVVAFVSLRNK